MPSALRNALSNFPAESMALLERAIKRPLFGCEMCGKCILQDTAFICPMACPKKLRDGPCGGVRADGTCETDPTMPCVWVRIYERADKLGRLDALMKLQTTLDWRQEGSSEWLRLVKNRIPGRRQEAAV